MSLLKKAIICTTLSICIISLINSSDEVFTESDGKVWNKYGDFSKILTFNDPYVSLNRSVVIEEKDQTSKIGKINISGYKDNTICVQINFKKPDNNIKDALTKNNLGKVHRFFDREYENVSNKSIPGYLDTFVKNHVFSKEIANYILKITNIEFDEESRIISQKKEQEINKILKLIKDTNKIGQKFTNFKINPENTFSIFQRHVGYTSENSNYPVLATYGAGPCIILALYNKETKKAGLAHIDGLTMADQTVWWMHTKLSNGKNESLEAHISGGDTTSIKMISNIINRLKYLKIKIKSSNVNTYTVDQLAIDSRTGNISNNFHPRNVKKSKNFDLKMKIIGMQYQKSSISEQKIPN